MTCKCFGCGENKVLLFFVTHEYFFAFCLLLDFTDIEKVSRRKSAPAISPTSSEKFVLEPTMRRTHTAVDVGDKRAVAEARSSLPPLDEQPASPSGAAHRQDSDGAAKGQSPPPLPVSLPPAYGDLPTPNREELKGLELKEDDSSALANEEQAVASTPTSQASSQLNIKHVTIAKQNGLGISVTGGINKQDGPNIYIDNIIDGLDVAKVWQGHQADL